MHKRAAVVAAFLLMSVVKSAHGESYLSASIGYAQYDGDRDFIGTEGQPSLAEDDISMLFRMGHQFHANLGVEAGLNMYSLVDFIDGLDQDVKARGYSLSVVGLLPMTDSFSAFAKAGVLYWNAQVKPALENGYERFSGRDPLYGIGLKYKMAPLMSLELMHEVTKLENIDLQISSLGATIWF